jgi:hypothetical protein
MTRVRAHRLISGSAGRSPIALAVTLVLVAALLGACGGGGSSSPSAIASASGSGAIGSRPSSPAVVKIVEPKADATVTGTTVRVVLSLEHAKIVSQTSTNVKPDEGHIHLYVNNVLYSMNYQLTQELPVHPGTYALKAEFVAPDHAPFSPRVWSSVVVFTVR